jgi:hypothetical protein
MNTDRGFKLCGIVTAVFINISIPANFAYSADCLPELKKAEMRWNKLRDQTVMTSEFAERVTRHLTMASELRHQGMKEGCLRQIEKAAKKMDTGEERH